MLERGLLVSLVGVSQKRGCFLLAILMVDGANSMDHIFSRQVKAPAECNPLQANAIDRVQSYVMTCVSFQFLSQY